MKNTIFTLREFEKRCSDYHIVVSIAEMFDLPSDKWKFSMASLVGDNSYKVKFDSVPDAKMEMIVYYDMFPRKTPSYRYKVILPPEYPQDKIRHDILQGER